MRCTQPRRGAQDHPSPIERAMARISGALRAAVSCGPPRCGHHARAWITQHGTVVRRPAAAPAAGPAANGARLLLVRVCDETIARDRLFCLPVRLATDWHPSAHLDLIRIARGCSIVKLIVVLSCRVQAVPVAPIIYVRGRGTPSPSPCVCARSRPRVCTARFACAARKRRAASIGWILRGCRPWRR